MFCAFTLALIIIGGGRNVRNAIICVLYRSSVMEKVEVIISTNKS
jgi:hypothetical protein